LEYSLLIEEIHDKQEKKPTCISERKKYFLDYLENLILISNIWRASESSVDPSG